MMEPKKQTPKFASAFEMQLRIDAMMRHPPEGGFVPHFNWYDLDMLADLILGRLDEQYIIFAKVPVYDEFTYGRPGRLYASITEVVEKLAAGTLEAKEAAEQLEAVDDMLHDLMHYCVKSGFRAGCQLGQTLHLSSFINIEDA